MAAPGARPKLLFAGGLVTVGTLGVVGIVVGYMVNGVQYPVTYELTRWALCVGLIIVGWLLALRRRAESHRNEISMLSGREWPVFLRFWSEHLYSVLDKYAEGEGNDRGEALRSAIGPVVGGTGIVMTVSLLERLILDALVAKGSSIKWVKLDKRDWVAELGLNTAWSGFPVLDGLTSLRHCFAHEYGRATDKQKPVLQALLTQLGAAPVSIPLKNKSHLIGPFYSIEAATARIQLIEGNSGATHVTSAGLALRLTTLSFLYELESVSVVDLSSWRGGASGATSS